MSQQRSVELTLEQLVDKRWTRREFIRKSAFALGALPFAGQVGCAGQRGVQSPAQSASNSRIRPFPPVSNEITHTLRVPDGYKAEVLLAWGDPIFDTVGPFDASEQSVESQLARFGYNVDFLAYIPLAPGPAGSQHGLLCCNHEYAEAAMMFPGFPGRAAARSGVSAAQSGIEMAAVGHSIVEIKQDSKGWSVVKGPLNRRISLSHTPMDISGPAAGHPRLRTTADPGGSRVRGTLANCSGGVTPWGTVLICEENINYFFDGPGSVGRESVNHKRYGMDKPSRYSYFRFEKRFSLKAEPNEPNRFGWVVEIDPMSPEKPPVKRTSLGRILREGAQVVADPSGHVVVYSGDDSYFEYIYRWVSERTYDPDVREANVNLLDAGTLSVASFQEDGVVRWLPLLFGTPGLGPENGFHSQADVLIEARWAADVLGATPMDRPEGVVISPSNGHVFAMLTKNKKRSAKAVGANPRPANAFGHVLEMIPPKLPHGVSHVAREYQWNVFLLGGDPAKPEHEARFHADTDPEDVLANPDNAVFDSHGRLWIASDGAQGSLGVADGLWLCPTHGDERALLRRFLAVPKGGECTGPCFVPSEQTLFVSVQHPGTDWQTTFNKPGCRWPDFQDAMPPRAAVVAISRVDGRGELVEEF